MLKPSDFNNAVPKFQHGTYANNPLDPTDIEEPSMEDYVRGVEPLDTLPAQWWNWLCNQFTRRFNKLNTYILNLFNEIAELLSLLNITPDGTESVITKGQLKNFFEELYPPYVKDHITITKSDVGLGNVPNVATNNQTPTYTEASALTALTSGEKLSVAFGKLAKAVSTLISHIADTSNPHSVTKEQVGLGNVTNTGDSATPVSGGTTKFTTGGAYTELNKKQNKTLDTAITIGGTSRTTVQNALEALNTYKADFSDFAPTFSTSATYSVGDYVIYNGNLYRCTVAHSAGSWNASHFTLITVGSELELKADKTSLAVPSDAVLHYSFDEVPDLPDGTAIYKRDNDFTSTDGWQGGATVSVSNNKLITEGSTGLRYIFKIINFSANSVIIFRGISKENGELSIFVRYSGASSNTSLVTKSVEAYKPFELVAVPSNDCIQIGLSTPTATNSLLLEISQIYIGDGSYSTPIIDNSGNKNNATNNGGIAVQGVSGKGAYFLEGKYADIGNFNFAENFTVSLWVKPDSNASSLYGTILYKPNVFYINNGGGNVSDDILYIGIHNGTNFQYVKTTSLLPPNIYTHVVIVKDGNSLKIYYDGSLVKSDTVNNNVPVNNNVMSLNTNHTQRPQSYDDLLIFNRALTEIEVMALYLNKANTPKFCETLDVPAENNQTAFSMAGAYDFFNGSKTSKSWLGKVFGHLLGREWTPTSTTTLGYSFNDVNYANGLFVASSDSHGLWWSTDGKAWTQTSTTAIQSYEFNNAIYANGIWVASSDSHGLWWSEDGKTWTQTSTSAIQGYTVYAVTYGNGLFVASVSNHGEWWSTNGKAWTQTSTTALQSLSLNSAIYANGIWVGSTASKGLWWSTDGKAWTQTSTSSIQNDSFYRVSYGNNGIWVASSTYHGLWWSENGKTWTQTSTTGIQSYEFLNANYGNGIWVACSASHGLWWSTEGRTWTQTSNSAQGYRFTNVNYANGLFIAHSFGHGVWWSTDGRTWTQGSSIFTVESYKFHNAIYANGIWVASTASHGLLYSDVSDLQLTD